ncbi:P-loop ATPase/GTPase-like protein [Haloterrigena turkmenica DSM 5511]|uniref:P-loop ATPase/GTPase-like protein n=1 Tax=Haloterrigena turkmenica (strain ATCC 51198 / DSM 5511 / JCM 9101 / NCIMB 13204 / VKM B-1734 / 4k) TaxID=543526 RepID=D2RVW5_HALTV|nr:ATPase [Haloterrigena turkmenica]ADB61394.1 P-loop ATPase/GTPase-like protein [Haloterrigena turkmenica DSM 5511]
MILLVVGADRVDAGKTTFSVGLLERTGAVGYKPRAGNDYWFDHDDCRTALADDRLYGKDAKRLAAAEGRDRDPEALNPVHRLWRPTPDEGTGLLGKSDREFLVDRVGRPGDGGDGPTFVRNATADIPDAVAEALPLEDAVPVETVAEFNELAERRYVSAFEELAAEIESTEVAVVESYSDIARPLQSLDPAAISAVAAVEPGRVRIYPSDRYCRACEIASSSPKDGAIEKRVPDVLEYLDPIDRVRLPPLGSDERADPEQVARAYSEAYDALLEAAGAV